VSVVCLFVENTSMVRISPGVDALHDAPGRVPAKQKPGFKSSSRGKMQGFLPQGSLAPVLGADYSRPVRVFNRSTVKAFADAHTDARQPLFAWFAEVEKAEWTGPEDIKARYPSASIVNKERVVFNIKGNNYRVVVAVKFEFHVVYIRFIGTHAEYDKIDATTV
jgi:mRNA interferase HigB